MFDNENTDEVSEFELDTSEKDTPLYDNCTHLGGCYPEIYAYTPQRALDENLFRELITNQRLIHPHIRISKEMEANDFPEQFSVGNICVYRSDTHPICRFCNLAMPVDMTYYTWTIPTTMVDQSTIDANGDISTENTCSNNACYLCYNERANQLANLSVTQTRIDSGMENLGDWIHIYTYVPPHRPDSEDFNDYCVYCNLHPNSTYYGRFAVSSYVYMLGDEFYQVPELSLDDLLTKRRINV